MNAALDEVYKAIEGAMPPEALVEIAPGELERVAMAALDASAGETWKARAERLADMHRDMCVVAGEAIARAERAEAAVPDLLCSLERMLLEFDFLVEDGTLPDIRNDIILVQAREAIAKASV